MAEGMLHAFAADKGMDMSAQSAGTMAMFESPASHHSIMAMREIGIDIESHTSKQVSEELVEEADIVLTMTEAHRDHLRALFVKQAGKIFTISEYSGCEDDIVDPFGGDIEVYAACRDQIGERISRILEREEDGS